VTVLPYSTQSPAGASGDEGEVSGSEGAKPIVGGMGLYGWSSLGRLLVVITSEGGRRPPRIISALRATKSERNAYARR